MPTPYRNSADGGVSAEQGIQPGSADVRDNLQPERFSWSWLLYLVILLVGIPWYWPAGDDTVWLGVPAWMVVGVCASAAASVLTAWRLRQPWQGEEQEEASNDRSALGREPFEDGPLNPGKTAGREASRHSSAVRTDRKDPGGWS